jgi:hypothetical protein
MKRFVDMPSQGWLSGDVHVHSDQNLESEESGIRLIASAEDVHVANVLMMGNVARTYFDRYPIEEPDVSRTGHHAVVEGQEDPRTTILGHTIHLNLTSFVRYPFDYLSYHKVFESVGSQGGISGFAHLTSRAHNAEVGMALLTPFDLVDFAEVMQANVIDMQIWTDFLNLGFKITPVAGSDFPYLGVPGSVRTYVRVNNRSNSHGWFEGLEKGAVFVTNGPVTDFSINGVGIGGEVSIVSGEEIKIVGSAKLNPDYGSLRRIDLITQGEVVATSLADVGAPTIEISSSYSPTSSGWYFIRVYGDNPLISAMTAPIYVIVDGNRRTWNRDKVPELTQRLIDRLDWLKNVSLEEVTDNEPWETMPVWQLDLKRQITSISGKVDEAQEFLKKLSSSARSAE